MTSIAIKTFSGELPNVPAHLLPDANSQQSLLCDFAQRDLRPLRQPETIKTGMASAIRGIYTEDGIKFFTWATETYARKSLTIGDIHSRVYYMNSTEFGVTQATLATNSGGPPSTTFKVGVPKPSTAPTLALVDRTALRGYTTVSYTLTAWYELNGKRYDSASPALTVTSAFNTYTFTPPTRTVYDEAALTGTPPEAKLCCTFVMRDAVNSRDILSVTLNSSSATPAVSTALPGTVRFTLTDTGTIALTWGSTRRGRTCLRSRTHGPRSPHRRPRRSSTSRTCRTSR